MKLLDKFNLSEDEQKLIKLVFLISCGASLLIVLTTIVIQVALLKKDSSDLALQNSSDHELLSLYEEHSKTLLPIDLEAHKTAASIYSKDKKLAKSIKHLLRVLSADTDNREIKLELATIYLKAGLFQKAEALFAELLNEDISDTLDEPILCRYGLALFYTGHPEQSVIQLDRAVTQFPKSAEAWCYRGQVEASLNMASEKSKEFFLKALSLDSLSTEALYQFARYYMNKPNAEQKDYIEARRLLLRLVNNEPLNAKAHSRLGMIYYYLNQRNLSEKSYKTALAINPTDFNTHYNLGELYYSQFNDRTKALKQFKKSVSLKHDHVEGNYKIGLISLENEMNKEAVQYLKRAHHNAPDNTRILLQLGVAYEKLSLLSEAKEAYSSILRVDELNLVARHKLKLLTKSDK